MSLEELARKKWWAYQQTLTNDRGYLTDVELRVAAAAPKMLELLLEDQVISQKAVDNMDDAFATADDWRRWRVRRDALIARLREEIE